MEAGTLNSPPALLERLVMLLTPPAARELVAGDLCEIYLSPPQYVFEAVRTIPYIVFGQMCRNANLPLLGLQAFLAFYFFGGFSGARLSFSDYLHAVLPSIATLLILLICDAYRCTRSPSSRYAILETILAVYVSFAFSHDLMFGLQVVHPFGGSRIVAAAPYFLPIICCFRMGLILKGDRCVQDLNNKSSRNDLARDYRRFQCQSRRRNLVEAGALIAVLATLVVFYLRSGPIYAAPGWGIVSVYTAAAAYLLSSEVRGSQPTLANHQSLVSVFKRELEQQNQLRRFMWWLWVTPIIFTIYATLIRRGIAADRPDSVAFGFSITALLCFIVGAINRERSGRVQEMIGVLAGVRGKNSAAAIAS